MSVFRFCLVTVSVLVALSLPAGAETLLIDGDDKADLAVVQAGKHIVFPSTGGVTERGCGLSRDIPVPGNFVAGVEGELVVWSPSFGTWSICTPTSKRNVRWGTAGDKPVAADFNGDGITDFAVFRPSTGQWFVRTNTRSAKKTVEQFGRAGDLALTGNFDHDVRADKVIVRPRTDKRRLQWIFRRTDTSKKMNFFFGRIGDLPVVADYNGDGLDDVAVWRPSTGTWYFRKPKKKVQWGLPGDTPAPADVDGDGKADLVVYRPSTSTWYLLTQKGSSQTVAQGGYGARVASNGSSAALTPRAINDHNGDGLSDLVVLRRTSSGNIQFVMSTGTVFAHPTPLVEFGRIGDTVLRGDFDGDRYSDLAVARVEQGLWQWFFLTSSNVAQGLGVLQFPFGLAGDELKPADYDGDGVTDAAVVRALPNNTRQWLINYSSGQASEPVVWGKASDRSVAADMDGDGRADFISIRESGDHLLWNFRLATGETLASRTYGLKTDRAILADFDGDGKSDVAVLREANGFLVIYVEGKSPFIWGLSSDAPLVGQFDGSGAFNAAVWRIVNGQGFFYVRTRSGQQIVTPFGVAGDRPLQSSATDTTGWGSSSSGGGDTSGGTSDGNGARLSCASRTSASSLSGGFVWKPVSESNGKLAVLFPSVYAGQIKRAALVESRSGGDVVIETLNFSGNTNGNRPTFRGDRSGRNYPSGVILVRQDRLDRNHCIVVSNPGQRYD